jgi:virginiamycin B lyase
MFQTSGFVLLSLALGQDAQLPDGAGKELVEAACSTCHEVDLITTSTGYTHEQWDYVIGKMIELPEPDASRITQYLAAHFPPTDDRRPNLVAGDARITFQEWNVPTLGQRPRDPLQTPDGIIWWAGMYGSLIGRLDPKTGEMKEYALDPGARPHSIIDDRDGNIWYTGNGNATIGKLDPKTGAITVYPMPDAAARDPHTPIFTKSGHLWFTIQNSNRLGRLVPDTGEVRVTALPTEKARPYGIKEDSKGTIWVAYRGANKIARVNPDSWEIREYPTPAPDAPKGAYIRRLAIASDDMVWYADSGRGYLGRLDPETGEVKEWPSPNGPESHPYAIEIIDGVIWYNESEQRPDALVRFDPKTETFQSWTIPSGIGIIRHMRATPDGNLVIHQSSTNTVGLVIIRRSDS